MGRAWSTIRDFLEQNQALNSWKMWFYESFLWSFIPSSGKFTNPWNKLETMPDRMVVEPFKQCHSECTASVTGNLMYSQYIYIYIYIVYLIWWHGHNSNGSLGKWPSHHLAAHGIHTTSGLLTSACSSPSNLKALLLWLGPLLASNMTRWLGPCLASHQLHEMSTSCHQMHQMWKAGDSCFSHDTQLATGWVAWQTPEIWVTVSCYSILWKIFVC